MTISSIQSLGNHPFSGIALGSAKIVLEFSTNRAGLFGNRFKQSPNFIWLEHWACKSPSRKNLREKHGWTLKSHGDFKVCSMCFSRDPKAWSRINGSHNSTDWRQEFGGIGDHPQVMHHKNGGCQLGLVARLQDCNHR